MTYVEAISGLYDKYWAIRVMFEVGFEEGSHVSTTGKREPRKERQTLSSCGTPDDTLEQAKALAGI